MSKHYTAAVVVWFIFASVSFGTTQTIQFDLKNNFGYGDGTEYLYSVTDAELFTESFGDTAKYWKPTFSNVPAEVVYKIDFPFAIQSATLNTLINVFFNYDPNATSFVDVSPDGTNWTNIFALSGPGVPYPFPANISSIVNGSTSIYVRDTFTGTNFSGFSSTQFLRSTSVSQQNIPPFILEVSGVPEPTTIFLDVKSGSDVNPINLKSKGVLPVAIISTDLFNAADVDLDTLLFGDPVLVDAGATGVTPIRSALEDVTGDGLLDLSLKFDILQMVDSAVLGPLSNQLRLTGSMLDGTSIVGSDDIRIKSSGGSGSGVGSSNTVPEPTSLVLIVAAGMILSGRRLM